MKLVIAKRIVNFFLVMSFLNNLLKRLGFISPIGMLSNDKNNKNANNPDIILS